MSTLPDLLADQFHEQATETFQYDSTLQKELLYFLILIKDDLIYEITRNRFMFARSDETKREKLDKLIKILFSTIDDHYYSLFQKVDEVSDELLLILYQKTIDSINGVFDGNLLENKKDKLNGFSSLIVGASLQDWVNRQAIDFKRRLSDQLNLALLGDETLEQTLNRVIGINTNLSFYVSNPETGEEEQVSVPNGGVLNAAYQSGRTLAKTVTQAVANAARFRVYQDNPNLIKGMEALVTLDSRTSDLCRGRSGFQWYLDGSPIPPTPIKFPGTPPWHPNCRTIIIPIFFKQNDFTNLTPTQKELINKLQVDGKFDDTVSAGLTYEGWLENQPEAKQKSILGKNKWALWKDGELTLTDMVNQNGNPLTLDELKNGKNNSQ